jgi:hypothetical protein
MARSPDHPHAPTRTLPLPTLLGALLSFRGASVQSELDAIFASLGTHGAAALVSPCPGQDPRQAAWPALWALNDRLIDTIERQGMLCLFKGRRRLAAGDRVCHWPRHITACPSSQIVSDPLALSAALYSAQLVVL